jgi:hypothetical protein
MNERLPTVITLTGAGGTGKTSVVETLAARFAPGDCEIHRSIVRDFYARHGVRTETDFLSKPPEYRRVFQMELIAYYMTALEGAVVGTKAKVLLCERSVFDHFAYTLYGTRELCRPEDLDFLWQCVRRFQALQPLTFYLPYPTPWDAQAADGFRAREVAKDTLVDAMICKLLSANRRVWAGQLPFVSVRERAEMILAAVFPAQPPANTAGNRPSAGTGAGRGGVQ